MPVTKRRSNSKKNLKSKKSKNSKSHKHQVGGSRRMTRGQRKGNEEIIDTYNSGYNTPTPPTPPPNNIRNASRNRNTRNTNSSNIENMRIAKIKEQQIQAAKFEIARQEQIIADTNFAQKKQREQKQRAREDQEERLMTPFNKWNPKTFRYQLYDPRTNTFI